MEKDLEIPMTSVVWVLQAMWLSVVLELIVNVVASVLTRNCVVVNLYLQKLLKLSVEWFPSSGIMGQVLDNRPVSNTV